MYPFLYKAPKLNIWLERSKCKHSASHAARLFDLQGNEGAAENGASQLKDFLASCGASADMDSFHWKPAPDQTFEVRSHFECDSLNDPTKEVLIGCGGRAAKDTA